MYYQMIYWMYLRSMSIICHIDRITNGTLTLTNIRGIHECKRNKNFFTIQPSARIIFNIDLNSEMKPRYFFFFFFLLTYFYIYRFIPLYHQSVTLHIMNTYLTFTIKYVSLSKIYICSKYSFKILFTCIIHDPNFPLVSK